VRGGDVGGTRAFADWAWAMPREKWRGEKKGPARQEKREGIWELWDGLHLEKQEDKAQSYFNSWEGLEFFSVIGLVYSFKKSKKF